MSVCEGVYEALELRDGGKDYMGKGVNKVIPRQIIFFFLLHVLLKQVELQCTVD